MRHAEIDYAVNPKASGNSLAKEKYSKLIHPVELILIVLGQKVEKGWKVTCDGFTSRNVRSCEIDAENDNFSKTIKDLISTRNF